MTPGPKMVNGEAVPLTQDEIDAITAEWAANTPTLAAIQAGAITVLQMRASVVVQAHLWMAGDPSFAPWAQQIQASVKNAVQQVQAAKDQASVQAVTLALPSSPTTVI